MIDFLSLLGRECGSKEVGMLQVPSDALAGDGEALARLLETIDMPSLMLSVATNAAVELLAVVTARKDSENAKPKVLARGRQTNK